MQNVAGVFLFTVCLQIRQDVLRTEAESGAMRAGTAQGGLVCCCFEIDEEGETAGDGSGAVDVLTRQFGAD